MSQRWDGGRPVSARGRFWFPCPANATTVIQENTGETGDEIDWLYLLPTTTTPGAANLLDGGQVVYPWPAGVTLSDLRPIFVPLNLRSRFGPWSIQLPANMAARAGGAFS